jgi:hypothetical protein
MRTPLASIDLSNLLASIPSHPSTFHIKLTDIPLLQVRQRIRTRPARRIIKHIRIALIIDVRASKQLYRSPDYARDEQHEQDEAEKHHGARE